MFFRAPSNIEQLEFVMCNKQEMKVQARTRMIEEELRKTFHPFVELPIVTQWSRQYDLVLGRYNFMVLDGDSCFGKTKFAFSLSPIHRTFYCDCTSGVPDLRSFDSETYSAIVLDELSPKQAVVPSEIVAGVERTSGSGGVSHSGFVVHGARVEDAHHCFHQFVECWNEAFAQG